MGARTNFELRDSKGSVWLYSHWGGNSKITDLQAALEKAQPRWGDDSYAMRIVVSQLIGSEWDSDTGYGLSSYECGEESYDPIVVDFPAWIVTYQDKDYSFPGFLLKDLTDY